MTRVRKHPVPDEALAKIKAVYRRHRGQLPKRAMARLMAATGLPKHTLYYHARRNGWTRIRANKGLAVKQRNAFTPLTAEERNTLTTGELRRRGICCCCKAAPIHPTLTLLCWACHTQTQAEPVDDDRRRCRC